MKRPVVFFVFLGMVFGGFLFLSVLRSKLYPAVFVNGTMVSARMLARQTEAAYRYYLKVIATYGPSKDQTDEMELKRELERAVLDKLIENVIIREELEERIERRELAQLIEGKLDVFKIDDEFQKAVKELYGFSVQEFRERILNPLASKELLEGALVPEEDGTFTNWLIEARKRARVVVVAHVFRWEDGQVQFK